MPIPKNINSGNAHLVNSYTHHTVEKIANNGLSVTAGGFLKMQWPYIDLAWPWDIIEGVSISKKRYESDNITVKKETVIYKQVKEYDTFLIKVVPWTLADEMMVGKTVDLDADQYIDLWTLGAGIQFRIEKVAQQWKEVEVILLDQSGAGIGTGEWVQWSGVPWDPVTLAFDKLKQGKLSPKSFFAYYNPETDTHEMVLYVDFVRSLYHAVGSVHFKGNLEEWIKCKSERLSQGEYYIYFEEPAPTDTYPILLTIEERWLYDDYVIKYLKREKTWFLVQVREQDNSWSPWVLKDASFSFHVPRFTY